MQLNESFAYTLANFPKKNKSSTAFYQGCYTTVSFLDDNIISEANIACRAEEFFYQNLER
jgi:hypothetical protein